MLVLHWLKSQGNNVNLQIYVLFLDPKPLLQSEEIAPQLVAN